MQLHIQIWALINSSSHEKNKKNIKKRFFNSLKNNKNKWQDTSNGFDSKIYISKHRLKRKSDILKK